MPPRFIARQLSCPTGLLGAVVGVLMNRHNAKLNGFALKILDVDPSDRVLEVGFGEGLNIPILLRGGGFVAGVDRSSDVVRSAKIDSPNQLRQDRGGFPPDIFTSRTSDEVAAALASAGFSDIRIERPSEKTRWNVIVAHR